MKKRVYITTPIYYPSAKLHLGHAYCTTLCDVFARYKRLLGHEVFFLTGADEHGEKIEANAKAANKTPQEFVDEIVQGFIHLWDTLHITNDKFIRTTDKEHMDAVTSVFSTLLKQDDIYLGNYEGWYCRDCESFWTDTQVGKELICPDCHRHVTKKTEETYFFKTQKYLPKLIKHMDENPKFLTPISRKNEMINTFIKPGLSDLAVSRTSFTWGVPVKENPNHVVYVWVDALTNYISALGYPNLESENFKKFWMDENTEIIHVCGADITRFHALYWPLILYGLNLRLPDRVFVHGLLMMKDEKMSKSKGNVIDPYPLIERYGVDAVRYYLVREIAFGSDGSFTPELFVERINNDLANDFGNLLNRTLGMINKYFAGVIPKYAGFVTEFDEDLEALVKQTIDEYQTNFDDLKITEAIACVLKMISATNKYIDNTEPWVLSKNGEVEKLASVMNHLANNIYTAAVLLSPVLVETPKKLFLQLGIDEKLLDFTYLWPYGKIGGQKVAKAEPLFPRLDVKTETEIIKNLMK
jgi:methionyl-tRNA synthetase